MIINATSLWIFLPARGAGYINIIADPPKINGVEKKLVIDSDSYIWFSVIEAPMNLPPTFMEFLIAYISPLLAPVLPTLLQRLVAGRRGRDPMESLENIRRLLEEINNVLRDQTTILEEISKIMRSIEES